MARPVPVRQQRGLDGADARAGDSTRGQYRSGNGEVADVYTEHKLVSVTLTAPARGISTVSCPQTCSPEVQDAVKLRWLHPGTRVSPRCAAPCWDTHPGQPRASITREGLAAAGAWPGAAQQAFRGDEPDVDSGGPRRSDQEQMR
jgi:hypothetical protein